MNSEIPLVTIAIPTYNREILLTKLVNSIPKDINISISDNGSFLPDKFNEQYENISIVKNEIVLDIFYNWNASIRNIDESCYLAIPSDDDLYNIGSFEFIKQTINSLDDIDVFIFGNNFIDEHDNVIGSYCPKELKVYDYPEGLNEFLYGVNVRMPSVFFKKSFLDKIGYFDEKNFTLTAADSELIQRSLLLGKVAFIPKIVSSYRVWNGSLTDQKIATNHWMNEIDIWTNKIIELAKSKLTDAQNTFDWGKYKDEIYARNLLAGLNNLYKNKKYSKVSDYFLSCRYPKNAMFKTKIRIFKTLILSKIKALFVS
ncbi:MULTISPECIES: glycosyltransferase family 2 protein [unclassified Sulfurospirillum]|uniref:glycosyltransferase family 2 protein n=1 Tax=unclassified Sulfurospirillum TaxID=2618290 RepID=UPI000505A37F|nr:MULTISPECIES: glycosyltransferase family 2 protein [unclassified Sulfurospirillum]KFL34036.1 hypothetical protein JU57_07940 [Sulfurospirillum sp. SCADC]